MNEQLWSLINDGEWDVAWDLCEEEGWVIPDDGPPPADVWAMGPMRKSRTNPSTRSGDCRWSSAPTNVPDHALGSRRPGRVGCGLGPVRAGGHRTTVGRRHRPGSMVERPDAWCSRKVTVPWMDITRWQMRLV